MAESNKDKAAREAADRRADYVRALEQEKVGLKQRGLDDRVKQVDAEIKRVKSAATRTSGDSQTQTA